MANFEPQNDFEIALCRAKTGAMPVQDMLRELVEAMLVVPSETEVMPDGSGMRPLVFKRENIQLVACFSEKIRIGQFASKAPFCLEIKGAELLTRLPQDHGIVINPSADVGLDISPEGIARIIGDFVKQ